MPDQAPHEPAAAMKPIGTQISTDRPCATCGFNLFGQMIQREPHYKLIVARCPECGTIASLQDYPAMTKWVGRWKILLAAVWIMVILGLLIGTTASLFGTSFGALDVANDDYSSLVYIEYERWINQTATTASARIWNFDQDWIENHYPAFVQMHRPILSEIDWHVLWVWLAMSILAFFWGSLWSTILLGAKRRTAFALMCFIVGLVFFFVYSASRESTWNSADSLANRHLFPVVQSMTTAVLLAALGLGVWLGRRFVRLLVCLTLPPRLRTPLAILWTRDGLDLPKPRSY